MTSLRESRMNVLLFSLRPTWCITQRQMMISDILVTFLCRAVVRQPAQKRKRSQILVPLETFHKVSNNYFRAWLSEFHKYLFYIGNYPKHCNINESHRLRTRNDLTVLHGMIKSVFSGCWVRLTNFLSIATSEIWTILRDGPMLENVIAICKILSSQPMQFCGWSLFVIEEYCARRICQQWNNHVV